MKKFLYGVLFALVVISCGAPETANERPLDAWVFRSVLDEKARMVTAALHEELWVAYDAQNANLYKVWKGGVNFDGAVYTTVHGPQPTSKGYAYHENDTTISGWLINENGREYSPKVRYQGHRITNGKLNLSYQLITNAGTAIDVTETPEYIIRGNQNGLSRKFKISNANGAKLALNTTISSLILENDYRTNGTFNVIDVQKIDYPEGAVINVEGKLEMNPEEDTELRIFYHPGFDRLGEPTADNEGDDGTPLGAQLINRSDCHSCHNENVKTVGPAYISVARKYNDDQAAIDLLTKKIIQGGAGIWGQAAMTAHPGLSESDANEMVKYILALDDNDEGGKAAKYALGEKSSPIRLSEKFNGNNGPGFAAHLYLLNGEIGIKQTVESSDPIRSGIVKKIHVFTKDDFGDFKEMFGIEFTGQIEIPEDGSYDFRLLSDDGSFLYIDNKLVIDNGGTHGAKAVDGEYYLKKGRHDIRVLYEQHGGDAVMSLQWWNKEKQAFEVLTDPIWHKTSNFRKTKPYIEPSKLVKSIPGDAIPLTAVHPSFDLHQARPDDFNPRVGGIDFFSDGRMVVCTWESEGPVFVVENHTAANPSEIKVKKIAHGLAEPLGIKVVDDEVYVLQKQELTKLVDHDGDGITDEYQTVSNDWKVSANFHEFAFGLEYKDGFFYATLATAIMPGGASASPQIPDRGKVIKINKETGEVEFLAKGLRTPNGIGFGADGELFIADNQGDWLPSSKIVHVKKGAFYGSRSVDPVESENWVEKLPVVWLPQDEIGNSPSEPSSLNIGPYKGQMIHGEVTHGGVKRVFVEKVNGDYQGAVFRFTQGLEAGINRLDWSPDGKSLYVGGVGSTGNWGHAEKLWYGLQRLEYNGKPVFDILSVSARSNGFELEFTEPIMDGQNISVEDFDIQQWFYKPTINYGGPKLGQEKLKVTGFYLSEDRKKVFFELPGIKENHVVYFRVVRPFNSENNLSLWTTEAWYTLNAIPENKPGFTNDYKVSHNQLTSNEQSNGWKLLFDGKTTNGIRNYNSEDLGSRWVVNNNALHFRGKKPNSTEWKEDGKDIIITDKEYSDFELYLEWKVQKGGNSGIFYRVKEKPENNEAWMTGMEMQVLDNTYHPDGQIFRHRAGDLYDLIESKYITANGTEEWNRVRLIVKDGKVQHWLNGHLVVEYDTNTEDWKTMIANSKFSDKEGWGMAKSGHISLQDHDDKVWFRNIKIREL